MSKADTCDDMPTLRPKVDFLANVSHLSLYECVYVVVVIINKPTQEAVCAL